MSAESGLTGLSEPLLWGT